MSKIKEEEQPTHTLTQPSKFLKDIMMYYKCKYKRACLFIFLKEKQLNLHLMFSITIFKNSVKKQASKKTKFNKTLEL